MKRTSSTGALLLSTLVLASPMADAQTPDDKWTFQAVVYGYLPKIGGNTYFPAAHTGSTINVDVDTLLSDLNFAFMGTLEARKGRWGIFSDLIYLDVSGDKSGTRDFSLGGHDVPVDVTSNLGLGIKGEIWTIAGEYAAIQDPSTLLYVVGGARLVNLKNTLSYSLSADVGPFAGPSRSGSSEVHPSIWDGIVGVKGRFVFGDRGEWFVPYYADVGTGQSQLTWQIFGGIGYTYSWGSVVGGWRYLDYNFKRSDLQDIHFSGPMIGVVFDW